MNDIGVKGTTYKNLTWKILKRSIASLPCRNGAWSVGWIYMNQHSCSSGPWWTW